MSHQAKHAIIAAKNWKRWGRVNAVLYCKQRGVPIRLLCLARLLEGERCAATSLPSSATKLIFRRS